jgi:serine/threonine protein kinase
MWSLGVTVYSIQTGRFPYAPPKGTQSVVAIKRAVESLNWNRKLPGTSAACKDLLRRMLAVHPAARISAAEAMQHELFQLLDATVSPNRCKHKTY